MVSAIIGAMVGMFLEMGLPSLRKRPYDPAIAEGCIGISVTIHGGGEVVACGTGVQAAECIGTSASLSSGEQRKLAEEIMRQAGALRIIEEESP